jgi:hypothetical protein
MRKLTTDEVCGWAGPPRPRPEDGHDDRRFRRECDRKGGPGGLGVLVDHTSSGLHEVDRGPYPGGHGGLPEGNAADIDAVPGGRVRYISDAAVR